MNVDLLIALCAFKAMQKKSGFKGAGLDCCTCMIAAFYEHGINVFMHSSICMIGK